MSEDRTNELNGATPFEERVLSLLTQVLERVTNVETRLTNLESRVDQIDVRLTALEDKVERRLQETRPIWEAMQAQLTEVLQRVTAIEKKVDVIDAKLDILTKEVLDVRAHYVLLEKRVAQLETEVTQ